VLRLTLKHRIAYAMSGMSISSIYLFAGIVLVAFIFWDAFEVMLLPLPIRRQSAAGDAVCSLDLEIVEFCRPAARAGRSSREVTRCLRAFILVLLICLWVGGPIMPEPGS
jgi:hypothetical protein